MKKIMYLAAFFMLALFPFGSVAATLESGDSYTLPEGEVVTDDLFIASERVQIDGRIEGDVFIGSTIVDITGDIEGSVFIVASEVDISGTIGNDLYVGAGTVHLSGPVGDNVYIGGGLLATQNTFSSNNDLIVWTGDAQVDGHIGKNLVGWAGALDILGDIEKSVFVSGGGNSVDTRSGEQVRNGIGVGQRAHIGDNFEYKSPRKARISSYAQIDGDVVFTQDEIEDAFLSGSDVNFIFNSFSPISKVVSWVSGFMWLMFVTLLFVLISKEKVEKLSKIYQENYGRTFGFGLIAGIAAPIIIVLIAVTIIGMPIAFIIGLVYAVVLMLSKVITAIVIGGLVFGEKVGTRKKSLYLSASVGVLLLSIASAVPFVGGGLSMAATIFGLGAIVLHMRKAKKAKNEKKDNSEVVEKSSKEEPSLKESADSKKK